MRLNIKYFGLLAEVTQHNEEVIEFKGTTISELMEELYQKYPDLRMKDFQVAQDNEIVSFETDITTIEIALLPPFAGG